MYFRSHAQSAQLTRQRAHAPTRPNFNYNAFFHHNAVFSPTTIYSTSTDVTVVQLTPTMSNNTIFNFQRPRTITSQLRAPSDASVASSSDLNNRDTIEALPQAIWNNRRFICDDSLATKGSRGRRTWIRNEGLFVREILPDGRKGLWPRPPTSLYIDHLTRESLLGLPSLR